MSNNDKNKKKGRPKKDPRPKSDEPVVVDQYGLDDQGDPQTQRTKAEDKEEESKRLPSWMKQFNELYDSNYGSREQVIYKKWAQTYLPRLPSALRYEFLLLKPDLKRWLTVFRAKTPTDCLSFVIGFIENFGLFMDPTIIAGRPLRVVVFLYYLNLSQEFLVFDQTEQVHYQYDGKIWQKVTQAEIIKNAMRFVSRFQLGDCTKALTHDQTALFEEINSQITLKKWPYRSGRACKNGFFHLYDGYYSLSEHSPGQWQRTIREIDIPEEIVPLPSKFGLRFKLDCSGESMRALNLQKLLYYYTFEPSGNQLLFNLTGNPRGSKSMTIKGIKWCFGKFAKEGNINNMNPFQLKDLLLNTSVILFPDTNPLSINKSAIDTVKRITGGDTVNVEGKYEVGLRVAGEYTMILVNNVNFEDVPAFREAGLADRVLNIVFPAIKSQALILMKQFEKFLLSEVPYLFLSSLSINQDFLYATTRAREVNAALGTGLEHPLISYIKGRLVYSEGAWTLGTTIYTDFHKYLVEISPDKNAFNREKFATRQGFYQQLGFQLGRMDQPGTEKDNNNKGVIFRNVVFGKPEDFPGQELNLSSSYVDGFLLENPLVVKDLTFRGHSGEFLKGPRINPEYNERVLEIFKQVKTETIKTIVDGGVNGYPEGQHFERTGFGGSQSIYNLKEEDFFDKNEVPYQPRLFYRGNVKDEFPYTDELQVGDITPQLFGVKSPFYFYSDGEQEKRLIFNPRVIKRGDNFFKRKSSETAIKLIEEYNSINTKIQTVAVPPKMMMYYPKESSKTNDLKDDQKQSHSEQSDEMTGSSIQEEIKDEFDFVFDSESSAGDSD